MEILKLSFLEILTFIHIPNGKIKHYRVTFKTISSLCEPIKQE